MKISTKHEIEFTNKEWGMRALVVGAPNQPGYYVALHPYDANNKTFIKRDPQYKNTLREAIIHALDCVGAD